MEPVEPPGVVFESAAECIDRDRAEEAFRQALGKTRRPGWVVTIRIEAAILPAMSADGEITDDRGARRAHQILSGAATDCAGLARAAGTWASAALDRELPRAPALEAPDAGQAAENQSLAPLPPAGPTPPTPPTAEAPVAAPVPPAPPGPPGIQREAPPQQRVSFASSEAAEKRDDNAPLELGVGTFLMVGGAAGGYLGVAPFLIDDIGHAVFLRPSVALGTSMATNLASTLAAARIDTCMRLPGRYAVRGGLQLDVCGGVDVGFSYVSAGTLAGTPAAGQSLPYVNFGPSIDLRAEVGWLAVTMRGVGGVNIAREGFDDALGTHVDASLWAWRIETDFSWVLHRERKEAQAIAQRSGNPIQSERAVFPW